MLAVVVALVRLVRIAQRGAVMVGQAVLVFLQASQVHLFLEAAVEAEQQTMEAQVRVGLAVVALLILAAVELTETPIQAGAAGVLVIHRADKAALASSSSNTPTPLLFPTLAAVLLYLPRLLLADLRLLKLPLAQAMFHSHRKTNGTLRIFR
jgi:hypothetical protein